MFGDSVFFVIFKKNIFCYCAVLGYHFDIQQRNGASLFVQQEQ